MKRTCLILLCAMPLLSACDSLPAWLVGKKKEASILPGERITALPETASLTPDTSLANNAVDVPVALANDEWPQHGGTAGNAALPITLEHRQSERVGDGNRFENKLVPPPVVGGNAVFAMDGQGRISAHDPKNVSETRWISPGVALGDGELVMGGGLAYDNGRLYATSGRGSVVALDAKTGLELWRQNIGTPIRSAPRIANERVYIVTDDSQLYALDTATGAIAWSHRGVNEGTGFLINASPAATSDLIIAPYASGTIHALHATDGENVWSDAVVAPQASAASVFTGIGGDPVIVDSLLYVAGSGGEFAAFDLQTGRRLWEQPLSSVNTPWVAGEYIYVLTSESAVVALQRFDGRVRWVRALPAYSNPQEKKGRYSWNGPVMAGGRLLVIGAHGKMAELSPQDGSILSETEIPNNIYTAPVIAGGVLYAVSNRATLYALY